MSLACDKCTSGASNHLLDHPIHHHHSRFYNHHNNNNHTHTYPLPYPRRLPPPLPTLQPPPTPLPAPRTPFLAARVPVSPRLGRQHRLHVTVPRPCDSAGWSSHNDQQSPVSPRTTRAQPCLARSQRHQDHHHPSQGPVFATPPFERPGLAAGIETTGYGNEEWDFADDEDECLKDDDDDDQQPTFPCTQPPYPGPPHRSSPTPLAGPPTPTTAPSSSLTVPHHDSLRHLGIHRWDTPAHKKTSIEYILHTASSTDLSVESTAAGLC